MAAFPYGPLVPAELRFGVDERVSATGEVLRRPDARSLSLLADKLAAAQPEAIAICLLFSFVEPKHERRVAEIVHEEWPDLPVSISFDVLPRWKEYERASTTIADAYLKPKVGGYLSTMHRRLGEAGFRGNTIAGDIQ